jgi:hypothetical protein
MFYVFIKVAGGAVQFAGYAGMKAGQGRATFTGFCKREGFTVPAGCAEHAAWAKPDGSEVCIYLGAYSTEAEAAAASGAINLVGYVVGEFCEHYAGDAEKARIVDCIDRGVWHE